MNNNDIHWKVNANLAHTYSHPLDTKLFHDTPLLELLGTVKNKKVLDIGCGNGYYTRLLSEYGALVTGIDSSEQMIKEARSQSSSTPHATYLLAPAERLPFADNVFDAAICTFTVNTFSNESMLRSMLKEAHRVLKIKGELLITLPNPETLDQKTSFRWTHWQEGQTFAALEPGNPIIRKIMQASGEIATVTNYYWPRNIIISLAKEEILELSALREPVASDKDLHKYESQLEPIQKLIPFFLLLKFEKIH